MEVVSWDKLKARTYMLMLASPKIFLGAFMWEAFALSGFSERSRSYYFLTGFGAGSGTIIAHLSTIIALKGFDGVDPGVDIFQAFLLGFSVFLGPGTAWQYNVNTTVDMGIPFTDAFFYVWFISMLLFFASIQTLRFFSTNVLLPHFSAVANKRKPNDVVAEGGQSPMDAISIDNNRDNLWYDLQASFAVGAGDAFFMGTSPMDFDDNWLGKAFGVYDSTPGIEAVFKAGVSTLIGFLIAQIVANFIIKDSWLDGAPEKDSASSHLSRALNTASNHEVIEEGNGVSVEEHVEGEREERRESEREREKGRAGKLEKQAGMDAGLGEEVASPLAALVTPPSSAPSPSRREVTQPNSSSAQAVRVRDVEIVSTSSPSSQSLNDAARTAADRTAEGSTASDFDD